MAGSIKGGLSSLPSVPGSGQRGTGEVHGLRPPRPGSHALLGPVLLRLFLPTAAPTSPLGASPSHPDLWTRARRAPLPFRRREWTAISSSPGTFQSGILAALGPLVVPSRAGQGQGAAAAGPTWPAQSTALMRCSASSLHNTVAAALPSERSGPVLLQSRPQEARAALNPLP